MIDFLALIKAGTNIINIFDRKGTADAASPPKEKEFGLDQIRSLFDLAKEVVNIAGIAETWIKSLRDNNSETWKGTSEDDVYKNANSTKHLTVRGYEGNDTLVTGKGNDQVGGDSGDDYIHGGSGSDRLDGGDGNDTIYGGEGDDNNSRADHLGGLLAGGEGNDLIFGGSGNDGLWGQAGNDLLDGGSGNDLISGFEGDDVLTGGTGSDRLAGAAGDDTFVFSAGDGVDFIDDAYAANDASNIVAVNAKLSSLRFESEGNAFSISYGDGDKVNLADGRILSSIYLNQAQGGNGFTANQLMKGDINLIRQAADAANAPISLDDALESLTSRTDPASGAAAPRGSERLYYLQTDDYMRLPKAGTYTGGLEDNLVEGSKGADKINGGAGDDFLKGYYGNDVIVGGRGNDCLTGGVGRDVLEGGSGHDLYLCGKGGGTDILINGSDHVSDGDRVRITGYDSVSGFWFARSGDNLKVSLGGNDVIIAKGWYGGGEKLSFANVSTGQWMDSDRVESLVDYMAKYGSIDKMGGAEIEKIDDYWAL